ncbi:MAG: YbaN family protein [Dehalococcoidales bacterium]|nr:YbaN family protein [Dehalococcoidales bacterium]
MTGKLKRRLLIAAGTISAAIGIVGIFVPLLPTTPFLLLAAACYLRSSQKFYGWLLNNRFIGAYLRNYLQGKGMPRKIKIITVLLLWVTITCSIIFAVQGLIIRVLLLVVAIGVSIHILLIKATEENKEN